MSSYRFLKADYRILVKAPHRPVSPLYLRYAIPGIVMMVVFAFIIPATYFLILWFYRHRLQVGSGGCLVLSVLACFCNAIQTAGRSLLKQHQLRRSS